jgi:hypothetical protein
MYLRTHVVANTLTLVRRPDAAAVAGSRSPGYTDCWLIDQKEQQVSDKLKEKTAGTTGPAPVGAKDGTLGAKDVVKRSVAKGGTVPTGAKDSAPVGAKDGTLGAKD